MAKHGVCAPGARSGECPPGLVEVLDYVRRRGIVHARAARRGDGLSRALIGQRLAALARLRALAEGGVGPLDRRPRAAHGALPRRGRAPPRRRSRRDEHRRRGRRLSGGILTHAAEPADIAAGPDVDARAGRGALRRVPVGRRVAPGRAVGHRHRRPGPGRVRRRAGRSRRRSCPAGTATTCRERFARFGVPVWIDNDVERDGARRAHRRARPRTRELRLREDRHRHRRRDHRATASCTAARRAAPATSATSRSRRRTADVICRCGNVNCLEALAGGAALARDAEEAARDGRSPFLRAASTRRARSTRATSRSAPRTATRRASSCSRAPAAIVGQAVAGDGELLQPVADRDRRRRREAGDGLLATIRQTVYRRSLPLATRNLGVHRSQLGWQAGVIGAATMVANELFAATTSPLWLDAGRAGRPGARRPGLSSRGAAERPRRTAARARRTRRRTGAATPPRRRPRARQHGRHRAPLGEQLRRPRLDLVRERDGGDRRARARPACRGRRRDERVAGRRARDRARCRRGRAGAPPRVRRVAGHATARPT